MAALRGSASRSGHEQQIAMPRGGSGDGPSACVIDLCGSSTEDEFDEMEPRQPVKGATKALSNRELGTRRFAAIPSTMRHTQRKRSAPEESMGDDGRAAHSKRTKRPSKTQTSRQLSEGSAVTVRGLKGAPQDNGKPGTQLKYMSLVQQYQSASNSFTPPETLAFAAGHSSRLSSSAGKRAKGRRAGQPRRRTSNTAVAIRFYNSHEPFYEFSNFWPCQGLMIDGKRYSTTEHYFQAQKFAGYPDLVEKCRKLPTARQCFRMVRDRKYLQFVRRDWHRGQTPVKNYVMAKAVEVKFKQDRRLMELLLSTGSRTIIEHTAKDDYWGDGGVSDWRMGMPGNHLGRILMSLRADLRRQMELA